MKTTTTTATTQKYRECETLEVSSSSSRCSAGDRDVAVARKSSKDPNNNSNNQGVVPNVVIGRKRERDNNDTVIVAPVPKKHPRVLSILLPDREMVSSPVQDILPATSMELSSDQQSAKRLNLLLKELFGDDSDDDDDDDENP